MSDEETHIVQTEEGQLLTAEYKDGQLQIVEVTPFDNKTNDGILDSNSGEETKYLQVLDTSKGLVHLDLLNFTLVKCNDDDDSTYQVVGTSSTDDGDTTLTCVMSSEDVEDIKNQDSYVVVNTDDDGSDSLVFLQSSLEQINSQQRWKKSDNKRPLTPAEILEKAKALQKAKAILQRENATRSNNRGRKRKSGLPPPIEMLASPNFKLYLYSCKMCNFKCNAVKEMSKHKASEHGAGRARGGAGRGAAASLQCARCPFRGRMHSHLMKHVQEVHFSNKEDSNGDILLDSDEVSDADVLVCGACGFESGDRDEFRNHIERAHGVNVMLKASVLSIEENSQSN